MSDDIPLRHHLEALQVEATRALDKADIEREKAASVLRESLAASIEQGDRNLTAHIAQEIARIRDAMGSADALEQERINKVIALIEAVQRELKLTQEASDKAIAKAEAATEKRFASVNEFRAQLADQTHSFVPREVAEAKFAELSKKIDAGSDDRASKLPREVFDRTVTEWSAWRTRVDAQLAASGGREMATERLQDRVQPWQLAAVTVTITLVVFIANILTSL